MNTLIHADIFFFVTTIVTIVVGILIVVALAFIIKILANIRSISDKIKTESELLAEDISALRSKMHENSFSVLGIIKFVRGMMRAKKKRTHDE